MLPAILATSAHAGVQKFWQSKINEITGSQLHAGTVRRWLPSAELVWRRAAPTLRIRDPHKDEKDGDNPQSTGRMQRKNIRFFYEDEVDIHLNPKIGSDWQLRGQQKNEW
uniref:Mobile element protein n=1 Tax=Klebsiella pneumoniae TaxID=573 RepID=A0A8B0SVR9_KLEPN|nr:Mobile element protein [Klebsiella pneumoniae]